VPHRRLTRAQLALTAATPVLRGLLSDYDVRWKVISASVDDRTPEERGMRAGGRTLRKSRYDSVSTYISDSRALHPALNDVPLETNEQALALLREAGVDEVLARHIAHLWVRDPLVVYNESIYVDDRSHTNHFENIQSTNWQTVRFKPPPPDTRLGWRVEFRSMEVQITDFENAAFTVFIALLTRAILASHLNFYIPMSKNEANMETAHHRDAVRSAKFYWRRNIVSLRDGACCP
jgi:glutamate--cysteine ligase catalytic subunit